MSAGDTLEQMTGQRIPGGCDQCDAYQTVDADQAPIYRVTVHHDDWCPTRTATRGSTR
ncbi:hypothetical protein AB4028_00310 [Janibacter sp. RAF20_2_2]|uniref:hypothetical protein n=1 Tax=unclassified Janibacter TaxID=2649294 RepID=UPI003F8DB27A